MVLIHTKREVLWLTGCVIFLLTVITAFMGYVLPWGQMSFWGATVITKLVGGIPVIGEYVVHWLWGGFSVDNATLNRFFSLHLFITFLNCRCCYFTYCIFTCWRFK